MDWHVTAGGLYGDLDTMRQREYQIAEGSLTLRPLFVGDFKAGHIRYPHSWTMVRRILTEFQTNWQDSQNKAEGLREALRKGKAETTVFKLRYLSDGKSPTDSKSPTLPQEGGFDTNGWHDNYCGYYDALELLDKYIPLETPTKENAN
jgi:hypothetical protein